MSRTVVINRSKDEVYGVVRQLKIQSKWVPWFQRDPEAILKYKGEDGKLGASFYWKGNNKAGEGIQRIVKIKQGKVMETKLLFVKPIKITALTYIGVKEIEPEKTKMIWGVRGLLGFPLSVISLFYSPEKLLGQDFDQGLKNLKVLLEKRTMA
ncbi:SRPBCC family protein [Salegentibacter chungangensis]|uniref:SRPBCC family protein n=1 Tax=Salegentibacter chungangensis TaxID=1335724 RepID=UPI0036D3AD85